MFKNFHNFSFACYKKHVLSIDKVKTVFYQNKFLSGRQCLAQDWLYDLVLRLCTFKTNLVKQCSFVLDQNFFFDYTRTNIVRLFTKNNLSTTFFGAIIWELSVSFKKICPRWISHTVTVKLKIFRGRQNKKHRAQTKWLQIPPSFFFCWIRFLD